MRGRGLKHQVRDPAYPPAQVAPHAGAWIETPSGGVIVTPSDVAPHAGAWIETIQFMII